IDWSGTMEYSAGMVSRLFWLAETRKTAELMVQGKTIAEIRALAVDENLYQVRTAKRAKRIAGATYQCVSALPADLWEKLITCDLASAKLLVLLSIVKTDLLFFEFMYTVYKPAVVLGERVLSQRAINVFFDQKIVQSEVVAAWSESAVSKLKQTYVKLLIEAGMLDSAKEKRISVPLVDYRLQERLIQTGFGTYLGTLTGDDNHG
ncbi:MAG: DUF1819 family protein, partial [Angelakisella sp.]